jgi:FtsP/CotA-like multicopper oxidase with cupredoxin domain
MSWLRRNVLASAATLAAGGTLLRRASAQTPAAPSLPPRTPATPSARTSVTTLQGRSLPFEMKDGVKEFRLVAGEYTQEFAPGFKVKVWGYNGMSPGPTIEAVEGDRVRILVTNKLPEHTSVHWHGVLLPSGMDGVGGLSGPHIKPGETYAYEFILRQHGTQMYHPHGDEMLQIALGMMGMFIIHPKDPDEGRVDRDFAWMPHAWKIDPGTSRPNPAEMTDFNIWSLNGRVFPATLPMVVRTGERVRIRVGNLSMVEHPMHLHGHHFEVSGTDGGPIPPERRWREATVQVPVGTTRDVEFIADNPGDWAYHCHKSHHTMNAMSHSFPNMVGVDQGAAASEISRLVPGYMPMGKGGMAEMQSMSGMMSGPRNTTPMMGGHGPYGSMEMGGMFTTLKVRDQLASYDDPGWYRAPAGTVAWKVS